MLIKAPIKTKIATKGILCSLFRSKKSTTIETIVRIKVTTLKFEKVNFKIVIGFVIADVVEEKNAGRFSIDSGKNCIKKELLSLGQSKQFQKPCWHGSYLERHRIFHPPNGLFSRKEIL